MTQTTLLNSASVRCQVKQSAQAEAQPYNEIDDMLHILLLDHTVLSLNTGGAFSDIIYARLPLHFMLWNGSGKPIQHVISFWLWAKGI